MIDLSCILKAYDFLGDQERKRWHGSDGRDGQGAEGGARVEEGHQLPLRHRQFGGRQASNNREHCIVQLTL